MRQAVPSWLQNQQFVRSSEEEQYPQFSGPALGINVHLLEISIARGKNSIICQSFNRKWMLTILILMVEG
jgi:hypothetical protein